MKTISNRNTLGKYPLTASGISVLITILLLSIGRPFCLAGDLSVRLSEWMRTALDKAVGGEGGESVLLICVPPIPLPSDASSEDQQDLTVLLDTIPELSTQFLPSPRRLSSSYRDLLEAMQVGVRPLVPAEATLEDDLEHFVAAVSKSAELNQSPSMVSELRQANNLLEVLRYPKGQYLNIVDRFRQFDAGTTQPFYFFPPVSDWSEPSGWIRMSLKTAALPYDPSIRSAKAELDIKRVLIIRSWLDESLFTSTWWRLPDKSRGGVIVSDGTLDFKAGRPSGRLPLIPTEFLLSRKLLISAIDENGSLDATTPSNSIIAVRCKIVPRSPNPDPSLRW